MDPSAMQGVRVLRLVIDSTLVGMAAALVAGYFALRILIKLVKTGDFSRFAWYCWAAAIASLVITLTR